jgi:hypothetical protein
MQYNKRTIEQYRAALDALRKSGKRILSHSSYYDIMQRTSYDLSVISENPEKGLVAKTMNN